MLNFLAFERSYGQKQTNCLCKVASHALFITPLPQLLLPALLCIGSCWAAGAEQLLLLLVDHSGTWNELIPKRHPMQEQPADVAQSGTELSLVRDQLGRGIGRFFFFPFRGA
ncbi:hypothetical protein EV426DRAFT_574430 [Tirmania nivea]|nr:hypothetical protein EV426DRAFT_574430 [Tirmania nivea]